MPSLLNGNRTAPSFPSLKSDTQLNRRYLRFDFAEKAAATSVPRGTPLDDDEADAYVADLQARVRRVNEATTRAEAIQKRNPNVGRAFMVLGTIELRANRVSNAVALLEKAAALEPDDFIVQSAYGRSLAMRMSELPGNAAALLPPARKALVRATTLNPRSARAAYLLGYAEFVGRGDLPAAVAALTRAIELEPRREDYRIVLAGALARQGEFEKATALLGPLMASGRTNEIREEARRVMGEVANVRVARDRSAAAPPVTTTSPVGAARPANSRPEAARTSGPSLRVVQPGEERVLGTLDAIDCAIGRVVLRVTSNGRTLALRATQFSDVDFISYRPNPGQVICGPRKSGERVYATYLPDESLRGIDGAAVAIELLPDDFVPPKPQ